MISSLVDLGDLGAPALVRGKTWHIGGSRIEAFCSRVIEMETRERDDCAEVWIGETGDPLPLDPPLVDAVGGDTIEAYRDHRGCEGIKVYLRRLAAGPLIEIARTYTGGSPVYVSGTGTRLCVSWKFEEAVANVPSPKPNLEACRIYLREATGHVREQVIDGVFMLWPGESLQFDAAGLRFRTIDPPLIVQPGTLHETADACGAFLRTIAAAMKPALDKADRPLIELSGGFDSSCVGLAAKLLRDDLHSYGLIQQGAIGIQQRKRRSELVHKLGVEDVEVSAFEVMPFAALERDECTITPCDAAFRIPCAAALDAHPVDDIDVIITGLGGDELTMENTYHRQNHELPGHNAPTAGPAAACRADMFMRRGIWPISPLTSPAVVDFCRGLPIEMRKRRMINVLSLARSGFSDGFLFPRFNEQFAYGWMKEAFECDFDQIFANTVKDLSQVVDGGGILDKARGNIAVRFDLGVVNRLYNFIKLHKILARYI